MYGICELDTALLFKNELNDYGRLYALLGMLRP